MCPKWVGHKKKPKSETDTSRESDPRNSAEEATVSQRSVIQLNPQADLSIDCVPGIVLDAGIILAGEVNAVHVGLRLDPVEFFAFTTTQRD